VTLSHLRRKGTYHRVCDPSWPDPSDTSFSKANGGRWNPPDRPGRPGFGALYLNATIEVARANARRHVLMSFGATIDDLIDDDDHRPDLQRYEIVESEFVDAVTPAAVAAVGLAPSYPSAIPHPPCQGIAEYAYAQGEHGIVPLSAESPAEEELVIFDRDVAALAVRTTRLRFSNWY
jgi:RES domain-containing protein